MSRAFRPLAGLVLVALVLAGCAVRPPAVPVEPTVVGPDGRPKVRHSLDNPAVVALWRDAETARDEGRFEAAATAIERALRIEPGDPVLWSRLAELRLDVGQHVQAENLAAKSNALAADNPTLRYRNWLIIGAARQMREDPQGVAEARMQSERLRQQIQAP